MPYIYKITNDINGKIYVGKTILPIEKRFEQHVRDSNKEHCKNRPLYRAINKYGCKHFSIELLEECDISVLEDREIYWINILNCYHNGYNATYGGDGKKFLDWNLIYSVYLETKNITKTAKIMQCCPEQVSNIIHSFGITKEEILINKTDAISKPVAMLDDDGNILKAFSSISDAERYINNGKITGHVGQVCNGKRKTADGHKWKFI